MSERSADMLDRASELTQKLGEVGLANVRNRMAPQQVRGADGKWPHTECVDCDVKIPKARLDMARIRCTTCEEIVQRHQKQFARN